MKMLIVIDRLNWSYHTIAKGLSKYNPDPSLQIDVIPLKGDVEMLLTHAQAYDIVFPMAWQLAVEETGGFLGLGKQFRERWASLPASHMVTGIHSHRAWDKDRTTPHHLPSPPSSLVETLSRFQGVNVVSRRLQRLFSKAGLRNLTLTENGVDTELFRPAGDFSGSGAPLRIGFSGSQKNPKHDHLKGVSEFIEPLSRIPGVELVMATPTHNRLIPLEEMPNFYNAIDLYVCMSNSEGFSQSVLEASACGRPVISTPVGGCEDLLEDGVNGFFVERDARALEEKVRYFQSHRDALRRMGQANREIVESRYSWKDRAKDWLQFALNAARGSPEGAGHGR